MKKTVFQMIAIAIICTCAYSCKKEVVKPEGIIYVRIVDDSGFGIQSYNDNCDCIPYNFTYGDSYGTCSEGTYSYSCTLTNGTYWSGFTFTLKKPANGKKRTYTNSFSNTTFTSDWVDTDQ